MSFEVEAGVYSSLSHWSTSDSITALLSSINLSWPLDGSEIPEEILEIILVYLHPVTENGSFDSELAQCSLTCRHWAAHI